MRKAAGILTIIGGLIGGSIPDNEITTNQIEASNSSASAVIIIAMYTLPNG